MRTSRDITHHLLQHPYDFLASLVAAKVILSLVHVPRGCFIFSMFFAFQATSRPPSSLSPLNRARDAGTESIIAEFTMSPASKITGISCRIGSASSVNPMICMAIAGMDRERGASTFIHCCNAACLHNSPQPQPSYPSHDIRIKRSFNSSHLSTTTSAFRHSPSVADGVVYLLTSSAKGSPQLSHEVLQKISTEPHAFPWLNIVLDRISSRNHFALHLHRVVSAGVCARAVALVCRADIHFVSFESIISSAIYEMQFCFTS